MKRRLNILCVIVVLVLSYSIFETAYYFVVGVKAGLEAGIESDTSAENQRELINMKYISLLPEHLSATGENGFFQDSVYNEKSGKYVPVDTKSAAWSQVTFTLLNLAHICICVWAIILFVRLVVSINKSDIFNWRNVRRLRFLGLALIISFCTEVLPAYLTYRNVGEVFSVRGYELGLSDMVNTTTLVLGISTLIVAEVFAIGLKMKEEQELTI